jgi:hypothetical protein
VIAAGGPGIALLALVVASGLVVSSVALVALQCSGRNCGTVAGTGRRCAPLETSSVVARHRGRRAVDRRGLEIAGRSRDPRRRGLEIAAVVEPRSPVVVELSTLVVDRHWKHGSNCSRPEALWLRERAPPYESAIAVAATFVSALPIILDPQLFWYLLDERRAEWVRARYLRLQVVGRTSESHEWDSGVDAISKGSSEMQTQAIAFASPMPRCA